MKATILARGPARAPRCGGRLRAGRVRRRVRLATCRQPGDSSTLATSSGNRGGSGNSSTAPPSSNPTQLLDEWAACMRSHGDPNQADPTIDANKVIHITWNPAIPGGDDGTEPRRTGQRWARPVLPEVPGRGRNRFAGWPASAATKPGPAAEVRAVHAGQRDRGLPRPANGNLSFNRGAGGDLNPNNPSFQNASKLCAQKTGVPGCPPRPPPPGTIEINGGSPGGAGG